MTGSRGNSPTTAPIEFDWFLYENGLIGSVILMSHTHPERQTPESSETDSIPSPLSPKPNYNLVAPSLDVAIPPISPIKIPPSYNNRRRPRLPQARAPTFVPLDTLLKFRQVQRHQSTLHPVSSALLRCWDLFASLPENLPPSAKQIVPRFLNPDHRAKIAEYVRSAEIPYLEFNAAYACFLREWCPEEFVRSDIEHVLLERDHIEKICADSWDLKLTEKIALFNDFRKLFSGVEPAEGEAILECLEVTWGQGIEYLVLEGELEGWILSVKEGRVVRGRAIGFLEGLERFLQSLVGYYQIIAQDNIDK